MDFFEVVNQLLSAADGMTDQQQKDLNENIFGKMGEAFGVSSNPLDDNLGENVLAQHLRWGADALVAGIQRGRAQQAAGDPTGGAGGGADTGAGA